MIDYTIASLAIFVSLVITTLCGLYLNSEPRERKKNKDKVNLN